MSFKHMILFPCLLAAAQLVLLGAPSGNSMETMPIAEVEVGAGVVYWNPLVDYDGLRLVVMGREGAVFEGSFEPGETVFYDLRGMEGAPLADGRYTYELRVYSAQENLDPNRIAQSGRFAMTGGEANLLVKNLPGDQFPMATNTGGNHFVGNLTTSGDLCAGCSDGASAGVGEVNGRARLKGFYNYLVLDEDQPDSLWLVGSAAGTFGVWSRTNEPTSPFAIEEDAPSSSFYLDTYGNIGLGTAVPRGQLDISDLSSYDVEIWMQPKIPFGSSSDGLWRLAVDSWGFALDECDVETSGWSCGSAFFVDEETRYMGLGTLGPQAPLHVDRFDGTSKILVEERSGSTAVRTQFQLMNNGAPRFALKNSNSGVEWSFQQSSIGSFLISLEGSGGPEMQFYQSGRVRMGPAGSPSFDLTSTGNLELNGEIWAQDFHYTSDRNSKEALRPVDESEILSKVARLPITAWRFKSGASEHMGPMAQDFYKLFGLGHDEKHLSPVDTAGVTLAAIQGLYKLVREKDVQLAEQQSEIVSLKNRLLRLEELMGM